MSKEANKVQKLTKTSVSNFNLLFVDIKKKWKADFLSVLLDKNLIIVYAIIFLFIWQIKLEIFSSVINQAYKYLVSLIPPDSLTAVLFIFIAILGGISYYNRIFKLQYRPSLNLTFLILFIGILYCSERFNVQWSLYRFWGLGIALIDIYLVFLLGEILSWIYFLKRKQPERNATTKYFGLDDYSDNNDEFGRNRFATEIATYICNSFGKRSLAVGVSGSWGTGKSYLINQVYKSIEENDNKSILLIQFNPWRSSSNRQITEDFLQTIKNTLSKYDRSLSIKFNKYLKLLADSSKSDWLKVLTDTISISDDKPSEQLYNEINDCLNVLNKKLVIFIDDLDRLHNEEILEVFRLIRNTANFRNTCFIVAFDREYVQSSFSSSNQQMSNYIDKILQIEFVLPSVDPKKIIEIVCNEILPKIDNDKTKSTIENTLYSNDFRPIILDFILHKRDAIRFSNIFILDFQFIYDDIDVQEFILLELLKLKYSFVYNSIKSRQEISPFLNITPNLDIRRNYAEEDKIGEYLTEIRGLYTNDRKAIKQLLLKLFSKNQGQTINSITYPLNYYKYFSLSVFGDDFSIGEFKNELNKPVVRLSSQSIF